MHPCRGTPQLEINLPSQRNVINLKSNILCSLQEGMRMTNAEGSRTTERLEKRKTIHCSPNPPKKNKKECHSNEGNKKLTKRYEIGCLQKRT